MKKRYDGFLAQHGLYVLDTISGEVRFIANDSNNISLANQVNSDTNPITNKYREINNYSAFENEVISSYPYLISKPFSDLLKETDSRMKCKLMVDTFTAILKYLALQLASEYIRAKDVKDIQIHQILTKDLTRPLISVWNLLIARCLPVITDNQIPLFSPEIKVAYEKLESKCKDPFLVIQNYSDEDGLLKSKTKKFGKIQALINYRNGLAHGFNQSQSRAQKEFGEYFPLLCDILQEIRFVSRYTLWHVESKREGVDGIRLMGANPSMKKIDFAREGINPAVSPLFLINDATSEILPLYAFFDVDDANETSLPEIGKDVFVFEGNTKNTVIYLSSNGEHLEKSSRYQHWKELLSQKQMEVEWVDTKHLTLEKLQAIGKHISSNGIQALISSAKYLREATIPRKDFNEFLDSFNSSKFNAFVLGGESGIGKSTLLAQKTEEWQLEGHMVAFYRGSALNQSDIANKFLRDSSLKTNYLEEFLSLSNPIFSQTEKKCYLIVDAINEYTGDINELIKSIENMVAQASNFPWFKTIVSIRDSTYIRVKTRFGEQFPENYFTVEEEKAGEKVATNIIRLKPFPTDFVEQLYNSYRSFKWKENSDPQDSGYYVFRPLTEFNELDSEGSTIKLIKNPLMARLVMQSFHRAKLPQNLTNDDAMRLYHDNIVIQKTIDSPGFPERKKLLTLLIIELDKHNTERLERDELMKIDLIRPYLINNQRDSPYLQLLELGALMEEWETDECYVRFAYDKFLEFLLAEYYWPRINDKNDLFSLCERAGSYKILQGAAEIIIQRLCKNNQLEIFTDVLDFNNSFSNDHKSIFKEMCTRVLCSISLEDNNLFKNILDLLPKTPSRFDLDILLELLDKLRSFAQIADFTYTLETAKKEALIFEDQKIYSDILLFEAELLRWQSDLELAKIKCAEIRAIKEQINDEFGLCKVLIELAWLERSQENFDKGLTYSETALILAKKKNYTKLKIDIYNIIGILNENKNDQQAALLAYDEALNISRTLNDKAGIARILNNKGNVIEEFGDIETAETMYFESWSLLQEIGDIKRISIALGNLGDISFKKGDYPSAEIYHRKSLEIKKKLGNKFGMSMSLGNLALIYFQLKNDDKAKEHFNEANKILQETKSYQSLYRSLHRAYSLFNKAEKETNTLLLREIEKIESFKGSSYILLDIELLFYCELENVAPNEILKKVNVISDCISELTDWRNKDIDDLPIEAFYFASKKLLDLKAISDSKKVASQALELIGTRKTRRKEELEIILNSNTN